MSQISVISGKTSEDLAKKIAKKIKANLVKSEIRIFPDGESNITLIGKISKKRSIVIQSIFPPVDSNLVHTLSLITKAKEDTTDTIFKERQEKRLANLTGGLVVVKVGGVTPLERKERLDRVEDAIHATTSAISYRHKTGQAKPS